MSSSPASDSSSYCTRAITNNIKVSTVSTDEYSGEKLIPDVNNTGCTPPRPNELVEPVGEDENPPEHLLLVELHELVVVGVRAHVDDAVHV